MDSYKGKTEKELVAKLGTPAKTVSNGVGGKVVSYIQVSPTKVFDPHNQNKNTQNINENNLYKEFYLDSAGVVYMWKTNYPNEQEYDKQKTKACVKGVSIMFVLAFIAHVLTNAIL